MRSVAVLRITVGKVARERAEDGPGRVEQDRHQRDGVGLGQDRRVDRVEHRRGVDRLVVEAGQELGDDQADEGAIVEIFGRLIRHGSFHSGHSPHGKHSIDYYELYKCRRIVHAV